MIMNKNEMIEWLYGLNNACENMVLVRANFKDYKNPHKMTVHKLIYEVIGALTDESVGMWQKKADDDRLTCPACWKWQTYGETPYCPNCGRKVDKHIEVVYEDDDEEVEE